MIGFLYQSPYNQAASCDFELLACSYGICILLKNVTRLIYKNNFAYLNFK